VSNDRQTTLTRLTSVIKYPNLLLSLECLSITSQLKKVDIPVIIFLEMRGNVSNVKTMKLVMNFTTFFVVHKLQQIISDFTNLILNTNSSFHLFNNKSLFHYILSMKDENIIKISSNNILYKCIYQIYYDIVNRTQTIWRRQCTTDCRANNYLSCL